MLDTNEISDSHVETFSEKRKLALQTLVSLKQIDFDQLKWMIKHTQGGLKKALSKYKKSQKLTEEICELVESLTIDKDELREVELSLAKTLRKIDEKNNQNKSI